MVKASALAIVAVAVVVGAAWWFVAVYDTAAARCDRGDAAACQVLADRARQQQEAAAAAALADQARRQADAATFEEERAREGRCYLRIDGHDATLRVSGKTAMAVCEEWAGETIDVNNGWGGVLYIGNEAAPRATQTYCSLSLGDGEGSEGTTLTVLDVSMGIIGTGLCEQLGNGQHL